MMVSVDIAAPRPAYEQIRAQLTALVNSGALPVGTRLPPIRQLATDLELAPGRVAKAYALLEQTGVASAHRRRGTIIQDRGALDANTRLKELNKAASSFAQTIRLLNIDTATARAAIDAALASSTSRCQRRSRAARMPRMATRMSWQQPRAGPIAERSALHAFLGSRNAGVTLALDRALGTIRSVGDSQAASIRRGERVDDATLADFWRRFTTTSGLAFSAFQLITRAESMGLIDVTESPQVSPSLLDMAVSRFADAGVGRWLRTAASLNPPEGGVNWAEYTSALERMNREVEQTPLPETEWSALVELLGLDPLSSMTGVSPSSVRRYAAGSRETPDDVADRLHFVALILADLRGSYNEYGIRRWFARPRRALNDATPAAALTGQWSPDDPEPQQVAALARGLVTMSVT